MSAASAPALPQDWTSTWLALLVSAAMGFLASLGMAAAAGAESLARSWTSTLTSTATVSVSPGRGGARAVETALTILRETPGVARAEPLDPEAVDKLLEPWLGGGGAAALALPRLIDVALSPGARLDGPAVARRLREAGLDAEVDLHGQWVARLQPAADRIRALAYGALAIIAVAAGLTVALACAAGLSAQAHVVDVLKLVGAEDRYITRIFVRRFQLLAFVGSAVGVAAAAATLLLAPQTQGLGTQVELAPLLPTLRPQGGAWAQFAAIPLAIALIATLAARLSVTVALRRREA